MDTRFVVELWHQNVLFYGFSFYFLLLVNVIHAIYSVFDGEVNKRRATTFLRRQECPRSDQGSQESCIVETFSLTV